MANVPPAIRSPRPNNIQYVPGDLYWNPTDLTDPDKYGTWLGTTAAPPELRTNGGSVPITDETFMNEVDDKLDRSMAPTLFALLAEHTSTLYELGFSPHYTTGKAYKVISRASTGLFRSDILAGKLLFLPYDRDNHNCILMYRALPELDSAARLARALGEAHVIPIVFSAVQDPVKNLLAEDLLANITLLPLIITNVSHGTPGVTTATITWDTNRDATSKVKYDTSSGGPYAFSAPLPFDNATFAANHSVDLSGLTGNTIYYYVVESYDEDGNYGVSSEGSFTTASPP